MQFALRLLFYMKVLMNLKKIMQYFNAKMSFYNEKKKPRRMPVFSWKKPLF